jgi:hypothetical protein
MVKSKALYFTYFAPALIPWSISQFFSEVDSHFALALLVFVCSIFALTLVLLSSK